MPPGLCGTVVGVDDQPSLLMKWDNGRSLSLITGKTLGESGSDLDRMFLISSAITKAFRGGNFGRDSVISLNEQEQRIVVNALAEQRGRKRIFPAIPIRSSPDTGESSGSRSQNRSSLCEHPWYIAAK